MELSAISLNRDGADAEVTGPFGHGIYLTPSKEYFTSMVSPATGLAQTVAGIIIPFRLLVMAVPSTSVTEIVLLLIGLDMYLPPY